MGDLTTQEAGARFAELICADDEWLRAEFDALVLASFGAPPAWPRLPAPPWVPPPERPGSIFGWPEQAGGHRPAGITGALSRCRQRSPPRWQGHP